jgi:dihydrofolate synthase/folylpolyglutamate synthase
VTGAWITQKKILGFFDNPEEKLKIIHIAGTSGKGSTAYLTSAALVSQGFKVGLHVSPWVYNIGELFQINGKLLSQKKLSQYFTQFLPILQKAELENEKPTYFELIIIFSYFIFYKEKVDYAVIEVGMGGRFDCTNVIQNQNKICVLNTIGLDHVKILGNDLRQIAWQKAGIIKPKNKVFALEQSNEINKVFEQEATENKAKINWLNKNNINFIKPDITQNNFNFKDSNFDIKNIKLSLIGNFQAYNCGLGLKVLNEVLMREKSLLDQKSLKKSLKKIKLPARFEIRKKDAKTFVLDGAHNPQKIEALIKSFNQKFDPKKSLVICGLSKSKDVGAIINFLKKAGNEVWFSEFEILPTATAIVRNLNIEDMSQKDKNNFDKLFTDPKKALIESLKSEYDNILITGSFYLLSNINHFKII